MGNIYTNLFKEPSKFEARQISNNSNDILNMRYYMNKLDGQKETSFSELCRRVSRVLASVDTCDIETKKNVEKSIYNDMMSQRYLFNSPCLFNAGKGLSTNPKYSNLLYKETDSMTEEDYNTIKNNIGPNQMLFACFVVDVPDSIEGIFDSVKKAAIISKSGGGVGANFGKIREKNALIKNGEVGKSSGPVSFMKTWNTMGEVVMQGGARRSALMGMLYSNHPDIEEFIDAKTEEGVLSYFNISVAIDDLFMKAVKDDLDYCLISPKDNAVVKTVKARDLYDKICNNAWKRGDPGIFFIDLANEDSLLKLNKDYEISSTNPCGEQPLPDNSSCNLGSINLYEFINDNNTFDYESFAEQIKRSIYYLDLVIDATKYPLPVIEKRTKAIRPVGLGIMGLADLGIKLGLKYSQPQFMNLCDNIGQYLANYSLMSTIDLAEIKGKFKEYDSVIDLFSQNITYNKLIDTLVNSDVETLTQDEIDDKNWVKIFIDKNKDKEAIDDIYHNILYLLKDNNQSVNKIPQTFKSALHFLYTFDKYRNEYLYKLFTTGMRNSRRLSIAPTGTISMILNSSSGIEPNFSFEWDRYVVDTNGTDRVLKKFYHKLNTPENRENGLLVTANELNWINHAEVVKIFAMYIDSAISKTINLPSEGTVDEIKDIYMYCYNNNIKGITIYRDGSRDSQPIIAKKDKDILNEPTKEVEVIKENYDSLEHLPQWLPAIRTKCSTPIGSVYVITTLYKNKPCEIYISAGKSGTQVKSMIESLSRVISIGLRSGVDVNNIIKTLIGITENERYIYETIDGEEEWVASTPDLIANILKDTMKLINDKDKVVELFNCIGKTVNEQLISNDTTIDIIPKTTDKSICPKCGSKMIRESGCYKCPNCSYSPCG